MDKELRKQMDMCICRSNISGELRRLNAIRDAFANGNTTYIAQGLELSIEFLEKTYEILNRY